VFCVDRHEGKWKFENFLLLLLLLLLPEKDFPGP